MLIVRRTAWLHFTTKGELFGNLDNPVPEGTASFHSGHPHYPTLLFLCSSFLAKTNIAYVFIWLKSFETGEFVWCFPLLDLVVHHTEGW